MSSNSVVTGTRPVTKPEFHAALCEGLSRAARKIGGMNKLADALEMTPQGLGKVFGGSIPCPKRIWDALAIDEHLWDNVADLYKRKVIPSDADFQRTAPALVAALHKLIQAESDGTITHQELLDMEPELRDAEKRIQGMLERINELRKPRCVG